MLVPSAAPVTTPVVLPIVAVVMVVLIQVPPATASLSVIVAPTHTALGPVMAAGIVYTATVVLTLQPVDRV
jgi:hypothetical protein